MTRERAFNHSRLKGRIEDIGDAEAIHMMKERTKRTRMLGMRINISNLKRRRRRTKLGNDLFEPPLIDLRAGWQHYTIKL